MTGCLLCQKEKLITKSLGICSECILGEWQRAKSFVFQAHQKARKKFGFLYPQPRDPKGRGCNFCVNQCQIGEGKLSFCGLRTNESGKLISLAGTPEKGILKSYYDPLPTNCVAAWVCPGSQAYGKKNLAVFYGSCSFDCLFCQNWHYKELTKNLSPLVSAKELADQVDKETFCLCFFGGDPTPQFSHALATAQIILKENPDVRICFETNGSMNQTLARKMAEITLSSKGIVKFDLKAFNEPLHLTLTGVSNKWTLENFEILAREFLPKANYSFLVASTLLVPGYVDEEEVLKIAQFIAKLNPKIPYSLLAFYPAFEMNDLPTTSKEQALRCQKAALKAGLKNVRLGNVHLLV